MASGKGFACKRIVVPARAQEEKQCARVIGAGVSVMVCGRGNNQDTQFGVWGEYAMEPEPMQPRTQDQGCQGLLAGATACAVPRASARQELSARCHRHRRFWGRPAFVDTFIAVERRLIFKPQANNGYPTAPTGRCSPHSREALKLRPNRSPRADAAFEQYLREANLTKRSCD